MRSGLNVARADHPQQRRTLFDLLYHTLFPDPSRSQATTALADPGASQSRVALTFYGRDKRGYRMIRDTVTGATKLYRYSGDDKKYRLFSEVSTEAAQFVRVQQQLPDEVAYERLFMFDPQHLPSRGGRAQTRSGAPLAARADESPSGSMPPARFMSGIMPRAESQVGGIGSPVNMMNALVQSELEDPAASEPDVVTDAEKRVQLERFKADLAAVLRAEDAQAELDHVQAQRSEIARLGERLGELRAQVQQIQAQRNPAFADLPDGIADRIRTFETRERRFAAEQLKLTDEQRRLLAQADRTVPLWTDRYFVSGLGGAFAFIALALLAQRPALALVNLPCALVAVGAGLRWVNDSEVSHRLQIKANAIDKQMDRLKRSHELDTAATRKLMKVLGTSDPSSLIDDVEADQALKAEMVAYTSEIARLEQDPAAHRAESELRRLDALIRRLESEVMAASGNPLGPDPLRRRIRQLEKDLGLPAADLPTRQYEDRIVDPLMRVSESTFARAAEAADDPEVRDPLSWTDTSVVGPRPRPRERSSISRPLPPMPAPGEAIPPTPDIPGARPRETSVPGVVAHRSTSLGGPPSEPRRGTGPIIPIPAGTPIPSAGRPTFDFSGGAVGSDDDDEDGYGSGYGGGAGGEGGGAKTAGTREDGLYCVGLGGGGIGGFGGAGGYGSGPNEPTGLPPDRSRDLVTAAIDLLQVQVDDLDKMLAPRLGQYLAAFTDRRFRRAEFGPRGEVRVAPKTGDFVPYPELDDELIDLVDASVKMALVEMVVRQFQIPVMLDDPFVDFPRDRRTLVGQMLAYLSSATQVIIATPVPDLQGHPLKLD